jgi:hypothetical protein
VRGFKRSGGADYTNEIKNGRWRRSREATGSGQSALLSLAWLGLSYAGVGFVRQCAAGASQSLVFINAPRLFPAIKILDIQLIYYYTPPVRHRQQVVRQDVNPAEALVCDFMRIMPHAMVIITLHGAVFMAESK